jgi:hypothetical protein
MNKRSGLLCKVLTHRNEKHYTGREAWGEALYNLVCRRCGRTLKAEHHAAILSK